MSKSENSFNEWVEETGIEVVAARLKTHRTTVINWVSGMCDPRVTQMREIKRITKGLIGYDEIIDRKTYPRKKGAPRKSKAGKA